MILVLIPVAAVLLGLGLWVVLRSVDAFNVPGADPTPADWGRPEPGAAATFGDSRPAATFREYRPATTFRESRPDATIRERIDELPFGCLASVIVASAVWVLAWLVVLLVGLSLLT